MTQLVPLFNPTSNKQIDCFIEICQEVPLNIVEVVLRSEFALPAIEALGRKTNMQIWAGTVLQTHQAQQVADLGVKTMVSPGFSAPLANWCSAHQLAYIAGVATATEVQRASIDFGLSKLKAFPADSIGGLDWLKAMQAVFEQVMFFPTGGINAHNLAAFQALDNVFAVGGSFVLPRDLSDINASIQHIKHLAAQLVLAN